MEYFAKSKPYVLPENKQRDLILKVNILLNDLKNDLSQNEKKILEKYIENIGESTAEEAKSLTEHLKDTVNCAKDFFEIYGEMFSEKEKQLILYACEEHDVGKANDIFQTKVNSDLKKSREDEIPHGFLSAVSLSQNEFLKKNSEFTKTDFSVLLTAIYYHHIRHDIFDDNTFREFCNKYFLDNLKDFKNDNSLSINITNRNDLLFSDDHSKKFGQVAEDVWCEYMLTKGLLNKFDWTVSAGYEKAEISTDRYSKSLCKNIEAKIKKQFRPAQKFMKTHKDSNVVVIAPTGSGKTEAALLWLDGEKGFYTLPLKVSSNAIYKRIKEKYQFDDVALLHSDSMNSYVRASEDNYKDGFKNYEQAKLFSYPLTVCTVDQLFKFVYKALGTEIFAATLKYSKIIIDEIQAYSPKVVAALIYGLSEIKCMGGKFAIITATFPPVLQYFMKRCNLLEDVDYIFKDFSKTADVVRHKIKIEDRDIDIGELIVNANTKKILVICNTVSKAQKLYEEIEEQIENVNLLHSRFIRDHREILEKNIIAFSNNDTETGIWITTQIVEASLDIDFDLLYTEMCTADSLLQRMGRCNRLGKKDIDQPNIIIYNNQSGRADKNGKGIYDRDIYDRSVEKLRKYNGMLLSETCKINYINEVYDIQEIKNTVYFKQIEKNISKFKNLKPLEYNSHEADESFRSISSITVIPNKISDKYKSLIENIDNFLDTPNIDRSVRSLLKSKLVSISLSLNIYHDLPAKIQKSKIKSLDIYKTDLQYDFDEYIGKGKGLILDKFADEAYFV